MTSDCLVGAKFEVEIGAMCLMHYCVYYSAKNVHDAYVFITTSIEYYIYLMFTHGTIVKAMNLVMH